MWIWLIEHGIFKAKIVGQPRRVLLNLYSQKETRMEKQEAEGDHRNKKLVAQWLRIHLPMQGTRVRALVWEDPTCHRATKPVLHNY